MDTVISLARPSDYEPSQQARFDIEFTKGRTVSPAEASGLQAHLKNGVWHLNAMDTVKKTALCDLYTAGASPAEMTSALGVSTTSLYRMIDECVDMGFIQKRKPRRS
jgi:hypothetical protein